LLEAAFVRSAFAHARIKAVDVAAARAAPSVHAVLTYSDIRPLLAQDRMPVELRVEPLPPNVTPYPLAKDEVVFAGEAIAAVIADWR
jgi:carbon-monoxide dehydrogenase large subunit